MSVEQYAILDIAGELASAFTVVGILLGLVVGFVLGIYFNCFFDHCLNRIRKNRKKWSDENGKE